MKRPPGRKSGWVRLLGREISSNPVRSEDGERDRGHADYRHLAQAIHARMMMLAAIAGSIHDINPRLLDHACLNLSAQDILRFLGRRWHPRCDGEVLTDCKKECWPGARIKHRVKNNWLKRYDK